MGSLWIVFEMHRKERDGILRANVWIIKLILYALGKKTFAIYEEEWLIHSSLDWRVGKPYFNYEAIGDDYAGIYGVCKAACYQ